VTGRYWRLTIIGLVIAGGSVVAVDWGLYHLVRTGSCGTDENGFSVGPPCPPETGGHIIALVFGIFAGLAGVGLYAARGKGGRPSRVGLGAVMWCLLWVTLAAAVALAAFGPAADSGSTGTKTAAIIMGVIFVPMGLVPIPFLLRSSSKQQTALELMTRGKRCPGQVVSVEDTNITINDNPRVKITVQAEPPGEPSFTVVKTATVSRVAIPRAGDRCTVFYDPADREGKNGITFDHVPGLTATPAAPTYTPASGPDYTLPFARPGEEDDGPLEKIERLGELRDKGLITQAEFDDQKRRLLGEV
jgi:hypothetical protein